MAAGLRSLKRKLDQPAARTVTRNNWSILSNKLLDRLFTFLNRHDQLSMSLAFHTWSREYPFPLRYRNLKFFLTEAELIEKDSYLTCTAERFAALVKNVLVEYNCSLPTKWHEEWLRKFFIFMQNLRAPQCQLTAIYFKNLDECVRLDVKYLSIVDEIVELLKLQRELRKLSFDTCMFDFWDGMKMFRAAIENNDCLLSLELVGFVELGVDKIHWEQILPHILGLPNLKSLRIDHGLILCDKADPSEVFELLKNHRKDLRMRIFLRIPFDNWKLKQFTSDQWITLRDENPFLELGVDLTSNSTFQFQTGSLIEEHTPVKTLIYSFNPSLPYELSDLFQFLSSRKIPKCLEGINLKFDRPVNHLESELIPTLLRYRKLRSVVITFVCSLSGFRFFMETLSRWPKGGNIEVFINCQITDRVGLLEQERLREFLHTLRYIFKGLYVDLKYFKAVITLT